MTAAHHDIGVQKNGILQWICLMDQLFVESKLVEQLFTRIRQYILDVDEKVVEHFVTF